MYAYRCSVYKCTYSSQSGSSVIHSVTLSNAEVRVVTAGTTESVCSWRWPPGPRTLQTLQSRWTVPVSGKLFPRNRSRVWSHCRGCWWVVVERWWWHKANTNSLLKSLWESTSVCVEYSIYVFTMTTSTIQKKKFVPPTDWLWRTNSRPSSGQGVLLPTCTCCTCQQPVEKLWICEWKHVIIVDLVLHVRVYIWGC